MIDAHRIIQARERREEREAAAEAQPSLFELEHGAIRLTGDKYANWNI